VKGISRKRGQGKLQKLDELAAEYRHVVQVYMDWLIARQIHHPNEYAAIPEQNVLTLLSERWQGSSAGSLLRLGVLTEANRCCSILFGLSL
jgi:hypothetical protein